VFKSHLFGAPTVVSCDEELNHFVLQNEERLFQCSYPGPIRGILGASSLLVVTGERHRRIRGMALAFVASTGLRLAYLADVDQAARAVVASWRGRCAVAFCDEARQVTSQQLFPSLAASLVDAQARYSSCLLWLYVYKVSRSVAGKTRSRVTRDSTAL
jgi:cytochrome P450